MAAYGYGLPRVIKGKGEKNTDSVKRAYTLLVLIIVLFVIAVMMLVLIVLELHSQSDHKQVCTSVSCVQVASSLLQYMDRSADPCQDFYQYSCGNFLNVINVPEEIQDPSFFSLAEENNIIELKQLLENNDYTLFGKYADALNKTKRFYNSCMNLTAVHKRGITLLVEMIEDVGSWSLTSDTFDIDDWDLQGVMTKVRKRFVHPLITYTVGVDLEHNEKLLISLQPGDITFHPDDYQNEELRKAFINYFTSVVGLLKGSENAAKIMANKIWDLEKLLVEIQDSEKVFTRSTVDDVQEQLGDWIDLKNSLSEFFNKTIRGSESVIYQTPKYFAHLKEELEATPRETLADYMVWRVIDSYAVYLTLDFFEAKFKTEQVRKGIDSIGPRWRFCFDRSVYAFKYVTSALFVEKHFPKEDKQSANDFVTSIAKEFHNVLSNVAWLGEDVKTKALEKLEAMTQKVGYPDMIDNVAELDTYYSDLEITDDFFSNILNIKAFIVTGQISRLGKPVKDTDKWDEGAKAHELSGFYNFDFNEMILPASIFVQPLFDSSRPMALNFGGLGSIVGHEMTHGFDNKGSGFDKHGNLKNWWSAKAFQNFQTKSECLVSQYGRYQIEGVHVNGLETLAENIADNGGIRVSLQAYQSWLEKHGDNGHEAMSLLPGLKFSEEQLFFLAFAQSYCSYSPSSQTVQELRGEEAHSPGKFRVLGPLSNMEEFSDAFSCEKGSPMNPTEKCRVW